MLVTKITIDNVEECLFFYTEDGQVAPVGYSMYDRYSPAFDMYVEEIKGFIECGYEYITMNSKAIGATDNHEILFQITLH